MFAQETIETTLIKDTKLDAETLVDANYFGSSFYINNNIFYKTTEDKSINYNNLQLGTLTSANTFNPLKINLFYKDFNTAIILDNRLSEIFRIDFNAIKNYKNVSHISTGHDNTLWIFNQDSQQLELFDYKTNTSRAQAQPVQSAVLDLKSNYNYCWLLTKNYLYTYNYFGSLIKKTPNDSYMELAASNENLILKKDNALFYLSKTATQPVRINLPNLLINQFFVTNETLYIYSHKILQEFLLKIN
ncbi:hypothetical protein ACFFU1_04655 [Algibacter miyuki]|uniref:Uncharacterized protein n=1 Tax=Algibacter miyuki TaxID=1306933 RepID=A0ABV5GWZ3_9FLAO|nr:hypothetical protein [Algibacter miyuki]MDN3666123.1 hypothetical protein [Algibacter miyuki]